MKKMYRKIDTEKVIKEKERAMKNIVLIGPVYPYKGGISHYTSLMYSELEKHYNVSMVSYKMQYPKFLFKKEQRDYSNNRFKIDNTNYWINTADPINCIISGIKILKLHPDLVILQWWHPYFSPCYWILEKILRKKTKILIVCHNVLPHERFFLDYELTKKVISNADFYIVQSKQDERDLLSIRPNAIYKKVVHPTYNTFKIQNMTKKNARELLSIDENQKILLFFGFVREYKGLKYLLQAMPYILEKLSDVKLLVVGDFDHNKDSYLQMIETYKIKKEVEVYDGYIPDQEVEKFFAACDLVVLPYESATQSGIVQIAYGFEKPVIVTNVGGLPEVVENGKTGYVVEPQKPEKLAIAVIDYFLKGKTKEFESNIRQQADRYSWDRMTEVISDFIERN